MTSLILLSGENEEELESRRSAAYSIAADRLCGDETLGGWGSRMRRRVRRCVVPTSRSTILARRIAASRVAPQSESVVLGKSFIRRMARKAKNVTKKAGHVTLQTARAAKQVSTGDISGALSRVGSTISNVSGSKAGKSLEDAAASMMPQTSSLSGWKGLALTGGGLIAVILAVSMLLKRRG